jgi:hypothetical protein
MNNTYATLLAILVLSACANPSSDEGQNQVFRSLDAQKTGIAFSNDLQDTPAQNIIEYLYYYNGGGVAVGDINNDGLDDVYFCANQKEDKLYVNKGDLRFEDVSDKAGISAEKSWSTGVAMDDVNGDGFVDIYVCKVSVLSEGKDVHNQLYINDGKGHFSEKAAEYGLDFQGYSTHSSFFDYDHDGDLDMYLLNHNVHTINSYGSIEKRKEKDNRAGDILFENRLKEEGKFVDVSTAAGIYSSPLGYGLAVSISDVNNDGWEDVYVGNDFHENDYLYLNNGDKTFTESIGKSMAHTTQFSMGVDIADVNNDGWNDVFTTDMMPYDEEVALVSAGEDSDQIKMIKKDFGFHLQNARNHFQINQGDGTFSDVAYMTRTFATDWSWSVLMQDFDNDLYADIFICNGIVKRPNDLDYINFLNELDNKNPNGAKDRTANLIEKMPSQPLRNVLFRHTGELTYTSLASSFVGKPTFSTGAAYADFDLDGDLDLVTNNINQKAAILENTTTKSNFIAFRLKGNAANQVVKGSKITVFAGKTQIFKELQTTRGFMSSSTAMVYTGLSSIQKVDSVHIIWPGNAVQTLVSPKLNKVHLLTRPLNLKQRASFPKEGTTTGAVQVLTVKHEENKYFDENTEKLIPQRLSFEGPAMVFEDMNGDGLSDLYIGGARNQAAQFFLGTANGSFTKKETPDFENDARYEDVDAATIDFDGDGDRDLYVVSGGNDNKELEKILEDRLYLNNGNGVFRRIPISLPHTNGSCVSVGDFDNDGFEDLFIGGRSIPGSYGLSPYSFVLRNKQGQGVEIAYKVRFGMVTDAEWVDLEGDRDLDLVICGEWMGITLLENVGNGKLEDSSAAKGTGNCMGLWNGIATYDFNRDGKMDILAGNSGLNFKWTASDSLPVKMYVGDFDGNGASEPLIFYHYVNRYMPFASLDRLGSQLSILKKNFRSYAEFKGTTGIAQLFDAYAEKLVEEKKLTELRSVLFLSEGAGYKVMPLALQEQVSDIQDLAVLPDGRVFYVGNYANYVAELGPTLANPGRILGPFDKVKGAFGPSARVPFPVGMNARKVRFDKKGRCIVAANDSYLYVVSPAEIR